MAQDEKPASWFLTASAGDLFRWYTLSDYATMDMLRDRVAEAAREEYAGENEAWREELCRVAARAERAEAALDRVTAERDALREAIEYVVDCDDSKWVQYFRDELEALDAARGASDA